MSAGALATAAVFALVAVLYLACGGETVPSPSPTTTLAVAPSITPSAHPTEPALPDFLHGAEVIPLDIGPEIEFPEDVALIVETGCTQCDGPTTGLTRVYRDPAGTVRTEPLFSFEKLGLGPRTIMTDKGPQEVPALITGFAVTPDASEMIVAVCTQGLCPDLGPAGEGVRTTLYRSTDGGVTWQVYGEITNGVWIIGRVAPGTVLLSFDGPEYQLFPGGDPVKPPSADALWAGVLNTGEIVWHTQDSRILRADGSEYFNRGITDGNQNGYLGEPAVSPNTGRGLAALHAAYHSGPPQFYLLDIAVGGQITGAYSTEGSVEPGVWIDEQTTFGNGSVDRKYLTSAIPTPATEIPFFVDYLPVFIDFKSARISPIGGPFLEPPLFNGRNRVVGVQRGPFARVVDTHNTCLNIRVAPDPSAEILDCAAEGVLLRASDQFADDANVVRWRAVTTPSGIEGWASTLYLEA